MSWYWDGSKVSLQFQLALEGNFDFTHNNFTFTRSRNFSFAHEIFTFPKCYSQIPLASSFSAQKFCKFTDMAAFAKSKVEVTMSKIENWSTFYLSTKLPCMLTNYFWINRNLCPFLSVPKGIMHHRPYNNYLLCLFISFISHYQTQLHCTLTWWSLVDHAKMLGKIGCALCAQWCFAVVMWKVIWWNTIQRNQATCWL